MTATIQKPRGFDAAARPTVFLGHGAGGDMESPLLRRIATGLVAEGYAAVRFNFHYREVGRRAPDRQPRLEATYRAVVAAVRKRLGPGPTVLGGKSMGGRMASYLAAAGDDAIGLALLGYPLHPAGKPERIRDAHFPDIRIPALFLQGDRDALCDLVLLRRSLESFGGEATLRVIEGGDHSFGVLKRSGRTDDEVLDEILGSLAAWLASLVAGSTGGEGSTG